jgi:hypothetical protein
MATSRRIFPSDSSFDFEIAHHSVRRQHVPIAGEISGLIFCPASHEDCVIRLFDVSIRAVIMLYELPLPFELTQEQRDGLTPKPIVTSLAFCPQSRQLSVGMTDGSVFLYAFSLKDNVAPSIAEWPAPARAAPPSQEASVAVPTESAATESTKTDATLELNKPEAINAAKSDTETAQTSTVDEAKLPPTTEPIASAQFRGFQLICRWQLGQPISTITLESALGLIAIGTFRGAVHLFGFTYHQGETRSSIVEQIFANAPPAGTASADQLSPVIQMRFMETSLEKYGAAILLVIARENGSVFVVNMKNLAGGAGRALTGKDAGTNEANKNFVPQLINFFLTTERGRQISLPKRLWITDEEQPKVPDANVSAEADAVPMPVVQPAPVAVSTTEPPELFLVMVFVNCIITYRIPAFEKAELVQTKAPLAWCCPIRVTKADQDECCLVCVDMGCNLYFYNLMSLKVHEKSYSLRSVGVDTKYVWLGFVERHFWY